MRPTMPWPRSEPGRADDPKSVPNVPTPEGRALGRELARFVDIEEAKEPGRFKPRCEGCAFAPGSIANGCPATLMDALKSVMERDPFYCHHGIPDDDEPVELCAGYVRLVAVEPPTPAKEGT